MFLSVCVCACMCLIGGNILIGPAASDTGGRQRGSVQYNNIIMLS